MKNLFQEKSLLDVSSKVFGELFRTSSSREWGPTLENIHGVITPEQNPALISPFTSEEIKEVAQQLGSLKAPGPDGFSGFFYQSFWSTVAPL